MSEPIVVLLSTWPDADQARAAAHTLVDEKLAACGNLVPAVESIYRWEGKVETAAEALLILKTTSARSPALTARLRELHPYEVPEILALPVSDGLPAYLRWVEESCRA